MKILFYIESLRAGGKERRLVELIKGLNKYPNIEMELVLTQEDIHYLDIFETKIKIHYTIRKFFKKDPRVFLKFYNITKSFKPDLINVWGTMVAIYAIPTKLLLHVPLVNNQITLAPLKVKGGILSYKVTFPFSDKIVANSYAGLKSYKAPKEKSFVIYNGFDFTRINNLENKKVIKDKFGINTPFVIGMVASFSEFKDYYTYVRTAIEILRVRKDITFLCIGAGDSNKYKEIVPEQFKKNILFLPRQKNVEAIMNICDTGVLTTNVNVHGEGISNALLEFSALKKPIIATNNGGTPEIIENSYNGFLIKPFDISELKERILFLINNTSERIRMGNNARLVVKNRFSINKMIREFYYLYKSLEQ